MQADPTHPPPTSTIHLLRLMAEVAILGSFMLGCYAGHGGSEAPEPGAKAGTGSASRGSSAGVSSGSAGTVRGSAGAGEGSAGASGGSAGASAGSPSVAGSGSAGSAAGTSGNAGDDAAVSIPDSGVLGPFELICREYSELPRPACAECLGNVQLACSLELTQFEQECGGAARCASRNCFKLCTGLGPCGAFCDCALSCLPPGESTCKERWQELLTCYARTCAGTC